MPVKYRITLLFGLLVFAILGLVCGAVYSISYTNRLTNIRTRLTNRAITTARLLGQSELFNSQQVGQIDAATTMAMKNKALKAYNSQNQPVYAYSDHPEDSLQIGTDILDKARINKYVYFNIGSKEAVAYYYTDPHYRTVMVASAYDEDGRLKLKQLQWILLGSFCGGVLIAFASGYFFSKELLKPVQKIADEVNEISANHFERRIAAGKAPDEWNYLAVTLNELLHRLQESFETQGRFIANASHELSTPLTSISSQLEVSLQKDREAADYRRVMQSVYEDVQQMNQLTQTLLELAKASGSSSGLIIGQVRMDEVLLALPSEMAKLGAGYTVTLLFDDLPLEQERLLVTGNEALLFLAVRNIVLNACKYSPDHQATVKLTAADRSVVITIEDKGIGIADSEISNIFQPFYRAHEHLTHSGFGLGLSLVYRIIKLHKGDIQVQSVLNRGTLFTLSLPVNAIGKA